MLPTRHEVLLSQFKPSGFPYFSASYGPLIAIVGGGGEEKSGVRNMIEIYQRDIKLVEYDCGNEANFYVQPYDDLLFTAGQRHLSKLQLFLDNKEPKVRFLAQIEIEEPHGLAVWKNLIVLATQHCFYVYSLDLALQQSFQFDDVVTGFAVNQYHEELQVAVLGKSRSYFLKTGIRYTDNSGDSLCLDYSRTYKQIEFLDDESYLAYRLRDTCISVLDKGFDAISTIPVKAQIALFRFNRQEQLLFVVTSQGRLLVFKKINLLFRRICSKQLAMDNFIHDFQFYSEDYSFLCLSVDGWYRGQILLKSYTTFYLIAVLSLLLFFLVLETRDPPGSE